MKKRTSLNKTQDHHGGFVLGVDGGGTKTLAAIVNFHGELCGIGQGGPSNYDDLGMEIVRGNISEAIQQARNIAGLDEAPFASAFFGMAGVVTDQDRSAIRQIVSDIPTVDIHHTDIDHDCRIALAGGLSGRPGIVLITGTGSSCFGQNAAGEKWLSGGWGYLISDEGSGYWLGLQAMRIASMVADGRTGYSPLSDLVFDHLHLSDARELMHRLYVQGLSRKEIAEMAPMVMEAAQNGDQSALRVIEQAANDLAICVEATARRLNFLSAGCEILQTGGLINAGDIYLRPVRSAILRKIPGAQFSKPELPPIFGACVLALKSLGILIDEKITQSLRQAYAEQIIGGRHA
jgi:N-acetylglucosamine kinase-like BadF-type ATPase